MAVSSPPIKAIEMLIGTAEVKISDQRLGGGGSVGPPFFAGERVWDGAEAGVEGKETEERPDPIDLSAAM
jgi:hypothetical protein